MMKLGGSFVLYPAADKHQTQGPMAVNVLHWLGTFLDVYLHFWHTMPTGYGEIFCEKRPQAGVGGYRRQRSWLIQSPEHV